MCVCSVAWVRVSLGSPAGMRGSSGSWSGVRKTCMRSTGQGFPLWIKQHWNGPYELSSPPIHHTTHANNNSKVLDALFSNLGHTLVVIMLQAGQLVKGHSVTKSDDFNDADDLWSWPLDCLWLDLYRFGHDLDLDLDLNIEFARFLRKMWLPQTENQLNAGSDMAINFYPRPVLDFGYCRCLRHCLCVFVCVCVYVCVSGTSLSVR